MVQSPYKIPSLVQDTNFLVSNDFVFKIQRTPHVNYFCQSVSIPGISITPINVSTPHANIPIEPGRPDYDNLTLTFKVDQDMKNYMELYRWIFSLSKPSGYETYKRDFASKVPDQQKKLPKYSDASLYLLSNIKNPEYELKFIKLLPISLSSIFVDTTNTDASFAKCTAFFQYDYFEIAKVDDGTILT